MVIVEGPQDSSREGRRLRFLSVAILLSCSAVLSSCGQVAFSDKHTAEESGYLSQFKAAFTAACRVGTTQIVQTGVTPVQVSCGAAPGTGGYTCTQYMPTYSTVKIDWLSDSGINAIDISPQLDKTLPPSGLVQAQEFLASTLLSELQRDTSIGNQSSRACQAFTEFEQSVQARTESYKTTESLFITYKPPVPVLPGIEYDTRSGFGLAVDKSITVPTKYGNVTAGYKSAPGIHMLRVVSEGKQRYLTLDRPFEFYIPKGYSTSVAYEGKDELILLVSKS